MIFGPEARPPPDPVYARLFGDAYNRLFAALTRIDQHFGGQLLVNSWHRTLADHARVKAQGYKPSETSQHFLGTGIDVQVPGVAQSTLARIATQIARPWGVTPYTGEGYRHLHLDALPAEHSRLALRVLPWLRWGGGVATSSRTPTTRQPATAARRPPSGGVWL